jgi:hypothetical protein
MSLATIALPMPMASSSVSGEPSASSEGITTMSRLARNRTPSFRGFTTSTDNA